MYINKINGKKYIGQTTCSLKKRHNEHLHRDNSYIDKALRKYGENNFNLIILEDNINDKNTLNEKEIYYIKLYDTKNTGYNLTTGGFGKSTFDEQEANKIIEMIKSTSMTFAEIGEKTNRSIYTISDINQGNVCHMNNINYPIRKNKITQIYSKELVSEIISLIRDTEYSFKEIADTTSTNIWLVSDINNGKNTYAKEEIKEFPIRSSKSVKADIDKQLAETIVRKLKTEDKSADQIGCELGIPGYTVGQINRGKHSICKKLNETYPIRKRLHRNKESAQNVLAKLSEAQVKEILFMILNTECSFEEIAKRFGVNKTTIDRINRKQTWTNLTEKYKAPIRTNPYNKKFGIE